MIKSLIVTNHVGESIVLELRSPEKSGFLIQSITGLGPVKGSVKFTDNASGDGGLFNSARIGTRNIVLNVLLLEKPTIEATRLLSYKFFPVKKPINIVIETDERLVSIDGYVETNEPNIFSKNESASISIICGDPYFRSLEEQSTLFSGISPSFEFPFDNNDLHEPLIEFGNIKKENTRNIIYYGESEPGLVIEIKMFSKASSISIYNTGTREQMIISSANLKNILSDDSESEECFFENKDLITINTYSNDKAITLLRNGVTYNIINTLDRKSSWFKLSRGNNIFGYTVPEGVDAVNFKICNKVLYEGI